MRAFILASTLLVACDTDDPSDTEPTPTGLSWYTTCGDPVCSGYSGPYDGVDACTTETDGDPCDTEGAQCDFESDCNALLVCAETDPKDQVGGCPISKAEVKREIRYLDDARLRETARDALDLKLATWRYAWEPAGQEPHLGFLIDDAVGSPAVRADGERVDLYGYTSLALAALQVQQAELATLRAELEALKAGQCPPERSPAGTADQTADTRSEGTLHP
jgi:hypothetical protein